MSNKKAEQLVKDLINAAQVANSMDSDGTPKQIKESEIDLERIKLKVLKFMNFKKGC